MACLNSVDLIATPGRRFTRIFSASTGLQLRNILAECWQSAGWTVERADFNGSAGYKGTSKASPWCASGTAPPEYKGKCRVWARQEFGSGNAFGELTGFLCMNEAETIMQTVTGITLQPTVSNFFGDYAKYSYLFAGNPYDFKLWMLGVHDRVGLGVSNNSTAVFAGVPQIPNFLQSRGEDEWCKYGINEMFYCVDASGMRTAGAYSDFKYFAGGISSAIGGEFINHAQADNRFGWFIAYGTDGGDGSQQNVDSGEWIFDQGLTPPDGAGIIWPSIIVWPSNPSAPGVKRMKGFLWDTVTINKGYPADGLLRFDSKVFAVFNNNWAGTVSPFRPPASILVRVA